jgi:uncharacterized membrane protein
MTESASFGKLITMEKITPVLLVLHVMGGIVSFIAAPAALLVRKGAAGHRLFGRIFFYAMTMVFLTACVLATVRWNPFLLMVGVFSYYGVVSGYRALYHKQLHLGKGLTWLDWVAALVATAFNVVFLGLGAYWLAQGSGVGILAVVFSSLGLAGCVRDIAWFVRPPQEKHRWLFRHIGNMVGAYVAALTAFSTQTMTFLPGLMQWLWPTLVLTPLIIFWIRNYRTKLAQGMRLADLVELKS